MITQRSRPAARTKKMLPHKTVDSDDLDSDEEGPRPPSDDVSAEEVEEDDVNVARLTRQDLINEVRF
jgi:hypothetical protein